MTMRKATRTSSAVRLRSATKFPELSSPESTTTTCEKAGSTLGSARPVLLASSHAMATSARKNTGASLASQDVTRFSELREERGRRDRLRLYACELRLAPDLRSGIHRVLERREIDCAVLRQLRHHGLVDEFVSL